MALALDIKNEILFLLGYPAKTIIEGSNLYNSFIADRLDDLDSVTEEKIQTMLDEISQVRVKLGALQDQGKLKRVGDIEFNVTSNDRTVKSEYKRLLSELGRYLDIKPRGSSRIIGVCL